MPEVTHIDLSRLTNITSPVRAEDQLELREETDGVIYVPDFDLVVEAVSEPVAGMLGDEINVTWTAKNQGQDPAGGKWTDNVYLSSNETWWLDDIFIGSFTYDAAVSGVLNTDDTYEGTLTTTVPPLVPDDYYLIGVRTRFYVVLYGDRDRSIRLYWFHMASQRLDFA